MSHPGTIFISLVFSQYWGSDSHVTSRPPRFWPIRGSVEGIFLRGTRRVGSGCLDGKAGEFAHSQPSMAAWLDAKWPRGELLKCHAYLILPLVSGFLLPWANSHLKRCRFQLGQFEWPSGKKHRGQVCRNKRQVDEELGRQADGQQSPGILVDCPPVFNERRWSQSHPKPRLQPK